MERTCKKCGVTKPIEEFTKSPCCRYGRTYCCYDCNHKYGKERYEKIKPAPKPKVILTEKACGHCGKVYPLTEEYFFTKTTKYKLADGTMGECLSFRWICKKCHGKNTLLREQKKRCKELGCDLKDYNETWRKHMAKAKMIHPEIDFPLHYRYYINRKIEEGYQYTTYEQYKKDCRNNIMLAAKRKRKYDYGDVDIITNDMANKMSIKMMTDARLAQIMGMSVRDVPRELLETKRLITILKREAGLTHSTKPNKN
jgi:hypothetical protein